MPQEIVGMHKRHRNAYTARTHSQLYASRECTVPFDEVFYVPGGPLQRLIHFIWVGSAALKYENVKLFVEQNFRRRSRRRR